MTHRTWKATLYWIGFVLLFATAGYLLFARLGDFVICECDEARHGINAYEMLQNGDWVINTYNGETDYFNLKPPLSFYGIMLGYRLFGFNALGMRFYSALSMLLCIGAVALWLKKRRGALASLGSLLFFLGCSTIYGRHFARFGDADALMVTFYTIGVLCMLDTPRSPRYLYGSALCFGLGLYGQKLARSPAAGYLSGVPVRNRSYSQAALASLFDAGLVRSGSHPSLGRCPVYAGWLRLF